MTDMSNNPDTLLEGRGHPMLERVIIRNYKSIGYCDLSLGALTILVGRNGAGKSNFLDALKFVLDGLDTSLDHAIKQRGGLDSVRRKSTGHPRNFAIELSLLLPDYYKAIYGFEISAAGRGVFAVKTERLRIRTFSGNEAASYSVSGGELESHSAELMPPVTHDRLYLVTAASLPEFRPVYDALRAMGFYNLNPDEMKKLQSPDAGELLHRDGGNIASVIARLAMHEKSALRRVKQYLHTIVPSVTDFERIPVGPSETLQFRQPVKGADHDWRFYAQNMSDGTLRALGALVAVHQRVNGSIPTNLIGIEEPETALHPAASGALMDALSEAAEDTQVIVTSHSPELLDAEEIHANNILVAESYEGQTHITELDDASHNAIQRHLYSAGELLRMDQLEPKREKIVNTTPQLSLFDENEINQ